MSRVARYILVGAVMDFTIYIALSLAPLLSERWGARDLSLAVLPVLWGVVYSSTAVWGGRISDRVSRTSLGRLGLGMVVATCLCFFLATRPWHFWLGMPVIAIGMSLFWPGLQAAIADESGPETLTRNLGWFNVAWAAGKGLGVLTGGLFLEWLGKGGFLAAAGIGAALLFVMPSVPRGGGRGTPFLANGETVPAERRRAFLVAALAANFAAFGVGTTIVNHYPEWNGALLRGGIAYGIVVGGVFLAQTGAFALLLARPGWHYRIGPHLALQALGAAGTFVLATALPVSALLPAAAFIGGGFGIAYYSSIYYSLHSDTGRGGRAGLHEAILGTGNWLIPLLCGLLTRLSGDPRVPYVVCGTVVALSLALQVFVLRRGRIAAGES